MRHPVDALWALFEDLPRVAECLPGVHVEFADSDRFSGRAEIRFGPVGAAFHGGGTRETDSERRTGIISGRSDARGHATLDAELRYTMSGEETHGPETRTRVGVGIRFRIQGGLAQFNRGDLVESFADAMLAEFAGPRSASDPSAPHSTAEAPARPTRSVAPASSPVRAQLRPAARGGGDTGRRGHKRIRAAVADDQGQARALTCRGVRIRVRSRPHGFQLVWNCH